MNYTIITVGKTHSWKTTFWKRFLENIPDSITFDSDVLSDFFVTTYPWLGQAKILPASDPQEQETIATDMLHVLKKYYPWDRDDSFFYEDKQHVKSRKVLHAISRLYLLESAFSTEHPVILTSAHVSKKARATVKQISDRAKRQFIIIYFNYSEEFLLERIKRSDRNKGILVDSKTFENLLLHKQKNLFEPPTPDEADLFFEITDDESLEQTKQKILSLLT